MTASISLTPIGTVETVVADEDISKRRREIVSDVVIFDEYREALTGIDDYSQLIVLFWMDRGRQERALLVHPRGDESLPQTGVLASRGRSHPNPIGLAVVDLLKRAGTRLTVRRLDAFDGTPVIDIKPYDGYDVFVNPQVPNWLARRTKSFQAPTRE